MIPVDAVTVFSFYPDRQIHRPLASPSALNLLSGLRYSCVISFRNSLFPLEYVSHTHFNIIFPSTSRSPNLLLSLRFSK